MNGALHPQAQTRALSALRLGALGDALGYLIEFDSIERIRSAHGADGLKIERLAPSIPLEASDDTQMALFALDGLLALFSKRPDVLSSPDWLLALSRAQKASFLEWNTTQRREGFEASLALNHLLSGRHRALWRRPSSGQHLPWLFGAA